MKITMAWPAPEGTFWHPSVVDHLAGQITNFRIGDTTNQAVVRKATFINSKTIELVLEYYDRQMPIPPKGPGGLGIQK